MTRGARYGSSDTDVRCPRCGEGTLYVIIGCRSVAVTCRDCHADYTMSELSTILSPEDFSRLAEHVGSRTSDRV